jgi:ribosomal protein S18 acetylase RimI-like enzyme
MRFNELNFVMGWAKKEGWNPGRHEATPLYRLDPHGYKLLLIDDEPIASLATVNYKNGVSFFGLYIVKPEYRGKGYGKILWDFSLDQLKGIPLIGLNGVLEQIPQYAKSGFHPWKLNTRFRGKPHYSFFKENKKAIENSTILLSQGYSLNTLIDYDSKIFYCTREVFLKQWLNMPETKVLTATKNGEIKGYVVASRCVNGYKIAPLFADDEFIAEKLCHAICQIIGDNVEIQLDVTHNNPAAISLAHRIGLQEEFKTLRMYRGAIPQDHEEKDKKTFGLTTLEIG